MPQHKNNWWKIAAAAVVLVSITVISYWAINKKEQQQIAKTVPAANQITPSVILPDTNRTEIASLTEKIAPGKKDGIAADTKKIAVADDAVADSNFLYRPSPGKNTSVAAAEKAAENIPVAKNQAEVLVAPTVSNPAPVAGSNAAVNSAEASNYTTSSKNNAATQGLFYDKTNGAITKNEVAKDQPLNRSFNIQVVDPENTPLPFANISIKNENFGTYADVKGNLRLVSSDSVLTVEVKSVGYQPKVYTIKSYMQQNKIMLTEDDMIAKQKTVVNSNTLARNKLSRRATLVKDSIVNVEPADGWENYNTYVDNNIEIPDDILKSNIHGQVEISFDVKANGTITNIKVDKSLCDDCDEAAKRLVEQGPQWKVKKGKKGKGKVTVQF